MWRLLLFACVAGCYQPEFAVCTVQCAAGNSCPAGLSCAADGFCHGANDTTDCREDLFACGTDVCAIRGKDCGEVLDSCGELIDCGTCTHPETCGAGGPNRCGIGDCTPRTCADAQAMCGSPSDGCSSVLDCGGCTGPQSCGGGGTGLTCGCGPLPTTNAPAYRMGHSQVITGNTVIIFGGRLGNDYYADGKIYSLASKTWSDLALGTNAPSFRSGHTAVWTGTEMIVWGGHFGGDFLGDGARFSPSTGTWTSIATTGAPSPRAFHTAVWTGTRMIVWGGQFGQQTPKRDGAQYDPATNTWSALPIDTATPAERSRHSAVWTGSEMIVWGGIIGAIDGLFECGGSSIYRDGARYSPATQKWTAIPVATSSPSFRAGHSAVWTGSRMIVWGGCNGSEYYRDGKSLDLATNTWTDLPFSEACTPSHRAFHRAVWTGDDLLVFGGVAGSDYFADGYRFGP